MTLGLARGSVRLADYDAAWVDEFRAERDRLAAALEGLGCEMEHVGSTAVPGMLAKPILDIALGYSESVALSDIRNKLERLGYQYRSDSGKEGGHIFVRGDSVIRTHHLHAVPIDDPQWSAYLALRELLRSDPESRDVYVATKRELAAQFKADRKAYTKGKSATIERLLRKARLETGEWD